MYQYFLLGYLLRKEFSTIILSVVIRNSTVFQLISSSFLFASRYNVLSEYLASRIHITSI